MRAGTSTTSEVSAVRPIHALLRTYIVTTVNTLPVETLWLRCEYSIAQVLQACVVRGPRDKLGLQKNLNTNLGADMGTQKYI
jgi:hypothetical protein